MLKTSICLNLEAKWLITKTYVSLWPHFKSFHIFDVCFRPPAIQTTPYLWKQWGSDNTLKHRSKACCVLGDFNSQYKHCALYGPLEYTLLWSWHLQQPGAGSPVQHVEKDPDCNWLAFIFLSCIIWFSLVENGHFILCPHQEIITEILSKGKQTHCNLNFFWSIKPKRIPKDSCLWKLIEYLKLSYTKIRSFH